MDYYGFPTRSLSNPFLRLDYLTTIGPRLVRLVPAGTEMNLLAETPLVSWETPFGVYHVRGGHRLWAAPQNDLSTAIPDNDPLQVEELPFGVRLVQPREVPTGLSKAIEVRLHPEQAALTLTHTLTNHGVWPLELSPWAITQLPLGGTHFVPLLDPRPGINRNQPNRMVTLWPYASWSDSRLQITQALLSVNAAPGAAEFKVGVSNHAGWAGYLWHNFFLCKRFTPAASPYPDGGSNTEIFINNQFTELETLGPLVRLQPGEAVSHVEAWQVYRHPDLPDFIPAGI
jgi:hypothetical protein